MEVEGTAAIMVLVGVFAGGLMSGFLWAGWSFTMLLRRAGYRLGDNNNIEGITFDEHE